MHDESFVHIKDAVLRVVHDLIEQVPDGVVPVRAFRLGSVVECGTGYTIPAAKPKRSDPKNFKGRRGEVVVVYREFSPSGDLRLVELGVRVDGQAGAGWFHPSELTLVEATAITAPEEAVSHAH